MRSDLIINTQHVLVHFITAERCANQK